MEYVRARGKGSPKRQHSPWAELCSGAGNLPTSVQQLAMLGPIGGEVTSLEEAVKARGARMLQRLQENGSLVMGYSSMLHAVLIMGPGQDQRSPVWAGALCIAHHNQPLTTKIYASELVLLSRPAKGCMQHPVPC